MELGVLVPSLGRQRCWGFFKSWGCSRIILWHFLFHFHQETETAKAETFFCFSSSSYPGLALQETAVSWQSQATSGQITQIPVFSGTCRGGSCWFLVLSGTVSYPHTHSLQHTRNSECSASTRWVQPAEEEAEKLTPQGYCIGNPVPEVFSSCHC